MTTLLTLGKMIAASAIATLPAGFSLALTSSAQAESFEVTCTSQSPGPWAGSMFCNTGHMVEVSGPSLDTRMVLTIAAPETHCSDVSYVINRLPGSSEAIAVVERLAPGEKREVSLGTGWVEDGNAITITAIGHEGGCNTGTIHSWGADVVIQPVAAVAASGPTLLVETSLATDCGANTPFEVIPGVASLACDRRIAVDFISPGPGHELELTLAAPMTHCSTVTYFVNQPGSSFTYGMTDRLSPGTPAKLSLGSDWPAGPQAVDIGAVGHVDGCNMGELGSWGVDVRLMALN